MNVEVGPSQPPLQGGAASPGSTPIRLFSQRKGARCGDARSRSLYGAGGVNLSDPASRLHDARSRTETRVVELNAGLDEIVEASSSANLDDEHDPEGATVGFERAQLSALLEGAKAQLAEIDAALQRLADGTYAACEVCGEPILDARLAAQPAARRCIGCAGRNATPAGRRPR
jgi:DnaK suppressor protein